MPHIHIDDAERQLAEFLAKFTPEIASRAGAIIAAMRDRLPGAVIPVYDNNALAVGFGPTESGLRCHFLDRRFSALGQPVLFSRRRARRSDEAA